MSLLSHLLKHHTESADQSAGKHQQRGKKCKHKSIHGFSFIAWYTLLPNCSPVLDLIESLSRCLYLCFYTNKIGQIGFSTHQRQLFFSVFYFSQCGGECVTDCVTLSGDNSSLYKTQHLKTAQIYIKLHKKKFVFIGILDWLWFMSAV